MNKFRVFVFGFGLLIFGSLPHLIMAQTANGGRAAFDFLEISPVARAVGMGGAYTALGDDVGAIYYNPAGLGNVLTNEVNITYLSLYQSMNYEFVGFACPMDEAVPEVGGTIAFSADLLQPGSMERTNDLGVTIGTFSSGDSAFTLAYARSLGGSLQLGISGTYIQQQIDTVTSSLFDMNAGLVVVPPFDGMRIGVSIQNLGAQSAGYDLPLYLNTGISYRKYELFSNQDDGVITADVGYPLAPIEDIAQVRLGGEYNFKWVGSRVSLRVGYIFEDNGLGGMGFTLGAGYGIDLGGASLFVDYAFAPADVFGISNRVSLTTKF